MVVQLACKRNIFLDANTDFYFWNICYIQFNTGLWLSFSSSFIDPMSPSD